MWKLFKIIDSPIKGKKLRAIFYNEDGKTKHTDFGAEGMEDYTIHHDKERRKRYWDRHKKDLETDDPTRAGFLSWYILWNKKSIKASVADYKNRFNI
jgi:hypothetical protein